MKRWIFIILISYFVGTFIYWKLICDKPSPRITIQSPDEVKLFNFIRLGSLPEGEYKVLEKISREETEPGANTDYLTIKIESTSSPTTHVLQIMLMQNESGEEFNVGEKFTKTSNNSTFHKAK